MTTWMGAAALIGIALIALTIADGTALLALRRRVTHLEARLDELQERPASPRRRPQERREPDEPNQPTPPLTSRDATREPAHPSTVAMPTVRPAETPADRRARERETEIQAWRAEQERRNTRREGNR
jgi:hypothetical protein